MIDYVLKYKTGNLIIIYYCAYTRLLYTTDVIIQNSMELVKDTESGSWVDG